MTAPEQVRTRGPTLDNNNNYYNEISLEISLQFTEFAHSWYAMRHSMRTIAEFTEISGSDFDY